ncbi:hypothetical protein NFHSH190041_21560 [Shewanella sp. NFH-SH190041]|uniref:hypothetical protein n=1 Tax=Shewanella sp. NFH-SH190041 TaxID=2950245 RepID=UPI0021C4C5D8|nr:hypothetical protein [Shewanella sp. NFH-SH190041]BDM64704.1 hypothetical protein NFHSH190041_21560 [Shewanella sp. NFH-SH190041]
MLTKFLLTLLVICLAWWFLTRGRQPINESRSAPLLTGQAVIRRYIILAVLGIVALGGLTLGAWHLYDSYRVMTVTITSPLDGVSVQYQVRKKDIEGERLTTLDGLQIRVSSQERMTISAR